MALAFTSFNVYIAQKNAVETLETFKPENILQNHLKKNFPTRVIFLFKSIKEINFMERIIISRAEEKLLSFRCVAHLYCWKAISH